MNMSTQSLTVHIIVAAEESNRANRLHKSEFNYSTREELRQISSLNPVVTQEISKGACTLIGQIDEPHYLELAFMIVLGFLGCVPDQPTSRIL